ncbi:uncharacterized protein LOC115234509 [Formica exsecta]|uniref:uncharacterized protein LOC115234509 n=1 Tax=Formica exsecta TaxID=72781 RepID=UPI001141596A|nr:uncharacterized protein LOC115234509 [Formica exsecta]
MRFSCFPKATIFAQKGSINVTPPPGHEESNNFTIGVIRPIPGTLSSFTQYPGPTINGSGPPSSTSSTSSTKSIVSPPPSQANHVNHLPTHQEQSRLENAPAAENNEQHVNNPREFKCIDF